MDLISSVRGIDQTRRFYENRFVEYRFKLATSKYQKNLDGSDQQLEEGVRIGIYQFELTQRADGDTPVCLDASDWFPSGRSENQVIMYRCQKEKLKTRNNQKWELWLKEIVGDKQYYVLRSQSKYFKGKVLAIRDKRLVLEDEKDEFDENQRWMVRWSLKKQARAIVWAGLEGEFVLQSDATRLQNYTDATAPEPFILQNYSNLPSQTWVFKSVQVVPESEIK